MTHRFNKTQMTTVDDNKKYYNQSIHVNSVIPEKCGTHGNNTCGCNYFVVNLSEKCYHGKSGTCEISPKCNSADTLYNKRSTVPNQSISLACSLCQKRQPQNTWLSFRCDVCASCYNKIMSDKTNVPKCSIRYCKNQAIWSGDKNRWMRCNATHTCTTGNSCFLYTPYPESCSQSEHGYCLLDFDQRTKDPLTPCQCPSPGCIDDGSWNEINKCWDFCEKCFSRENRSYWRRNG
jgi:hypothetical protein